MPKELIYSKGDMVGPFRIVRPVALGSKSTVYEAVPELPPHGEDLLTLGIRRVAVKVARLENGQLDREALKRRADRFDREYRTLVKLMHPGHSGVVEVYEAGWKDDAPWMAMQWVDGHTLAELLAQPVPMQQMLDAFYKLCGAVAYLHERGVCHRSLEPSNVLLRAENNEPVLIGFDFCLPPAERRLTLPGEPLGSLLYRSPEYARHWMSTDGERAYLDAPTDDVWALGVLLYRILTGAPPWQTPELRDQTLLKEICKVTPPHPSQVNPQVPRALGKAALRLLEKDWRKRAPNGTAVLELLKPARKTTPVTGFVPVRSTRWRRAPGVRNAERTGSSKRRWTELAKWLAIATVALATYGLGRELRGYLENREESGRLAPEKQVVAIPYGPQAPQAARREEGSVPGEDAAKHGPIEDSAPDEPLQIEGKPLPAHPLEGQRRPPCGRHYVARSGGCWREFLNFDPDGLPAPCPPDTYEEKGKDGRWHCFEALIVPRPNAAQPAELKR